MMDNGYPQNTEFKILKEFIKTESFELKKVKDIYSKLTLYRIKSRINLTSML